MKLGTSLCDDSLSLLFLHLCPACEKELSKGEVICTFCKDELPQTNYHLEKENPVEQVFWDRVKIEKAASFYFLSRDSKVQHLIHNFKYNGLYDIGIEVGTLYGMQLKDTAFNDIDIIIPVPLHPARERKRGYNQAAMFAKGLAQTLNIPWNSKIVKRIKNTKTQTKQTKEERIENVKNAFQIIDAELMSDKHILLVDDVLTTGATLESCARTLLEVKKTKVSIATMALAR